MATTISEDRLAQVAAQSDDALAYQQGIADISRDFNISITAVHLELEMFKKLRA